MEALARGANTSILAKMSCLYLDQIFCMDCPSQIGFYGTMLIHSMLLWVVIIRGLMVITLCRSCFSTGTETSSSWVITKSHPSMVVNKA